MLKGLLLSKTFYFNLITGVLAVLALPEVVAIIPLEYLPVIGLFTAIGNIVLRTITNLPLNEKTSLLE